MRHLMMATATTATATTATAMILLPVPAMAAKAATPPAKAAIPPVRAVRAAKAMILLPAPAMAAKAMILLPVPAMAAKAATPPVKAAKAAKAARPILRSSSPKELFLFSLSTNKLKLHKMNNFSYSESLRYKRLSDTFSKNFRLTHLFSAYLERFPDAISEEMISAVCEGGRIRPEDAIAAILSELFGLDTERNDEDRSLFRDYLMPSIRIMDAEKYRSDPYYKNIKLENITHGHWEIRKEAYEPYRAVIAGDMIIHSDFSEIPPLGFFTERFEFPAVLEDGNEWMTLTPVDLDTCEDAISRARGKVITFGLGLGYYAYMVSEKEDVESITVIEKSREVIELFKKYILPQFPNKDKVRIIEADAFIYAEENMPSEGYDFAFVDTWRDASDGAPMYKKMKALEHLSPTTEFSYWIENFLISRLRAERFYDINERYKAGENELTLDEIIASVSFPLSSGQNTPPN